MSSWQVVFKSNNEYQAEMVRSVLENSDINAVVFNLKDHAYKFGHLEVRVPPELVLRAIKLIDDEIKFNDE